jgi:hypothetical protein
MQRPPGRREVERVLVSAKPVKIQCEGEFPDIAIIRGVFLTTPIPSEAFEIPERPPPVVKSRDDVLAELRTLWGSPDDACGPIGERYRFADLDK